MSDALSPAESVFLRFLAGFSADDVRDAITHDIDLGRLVVEEYGQDEEGIALINQARQYASLYEVTHPNARGQLNDVSMSAQKVLEWLVKYKPDLGYEIATYESLRTATAAGLTAIGPDVTAYTYTVQEHAGLAWLKKNIQSLAAVIL